MAIDKSDPFPNLPPPWLLRRTVPAINRRPPLPATPVTKIAKPLPKSVTEKPSVTELRETVAAVPTTKPKRGRNPKGDWPLTAAEKQRLYRERKKAKTASA